MNRHVALLRGVNVGGRNRLPMKDLVALFERAGCASVTTCIQSGNVLYSASSALAKRIPALIEEALREELGLSTPVITRTAAEIRRVAASHPLGAAGDEDKLSVAFLATSPSAARASSLDADRSPPDRFLVRGREIYLITPNGMARSKLTNAWFDRGLATVSTVRNWKTVQALVAAVDEG